MQSPAPCQFPGVPLGLEAVEHTIDAGDLAIMSVPAKLATAARCLLGRSAVMGKYAANPSSSPLIETHVARHTPMVMYVTCTITLFLSVLISRQSQHLQLCESRGPKTQPKLGSA